MKDSLLENILFQNILGAIGFATIIPVGTVAFNPRQLAANLPVAGLLIGLLLALFDLLLGGLWSRPAVSALEIVLLAVITGALHLDGLADTADGLYGQNSRERALEIMKDSRTGAMGVVAIVCCLAVKWAGLSNLDDSRLWLLILIPAYARAGNLFGFRFLEYGRQGQGTALAFFEEEFTGSDFRWLALLVGLSVFAGWQMVVLNLGFLVIVILILWFYKRKIGCITGDMLGAMVEVTEAGLFLAVSAL